SVERAFNRVPAEIRRSPSAEHSRSTRPGRAIFVARHADWVASLVHTRRSSRTNSWLMTVIGSMITSCRFNLPVGCMNLLLVLHHARARKRCHFALEKLP